MKRSGGKTWKALLAAAVVGVGGYLLWKKFGGSASASSYKWNPDTKNFNSPQNFGPELLPGQQPYVLAADQQYAASHVINPFTGEERVISQ